MGRPLNGRIALVTGATGGIGTAVVHRLAADGATVAATHLGEPEAMHTLTEAVTDAGGTIATFETDLRDPAAINRLTHQVHEHLGPIDILVSNAGAYPRIPWAKLTPDHWHDQLQTNLTSHYLLAHALTPDLARHGQGRIITLGSVLATAGRHDLAAYIAAKAGLEGLTRALARELGPLGTTANCIAPGSIRVAAEDRVVDDPEVMTSRQLARQCIQRRGRPNDVAAAIAFLATDDAGFITGQTLRVDGGWILG
jgi:3-oxoacyl-[acyl-carrier protein] reductase